ncbi:MAG: selenide, water dikinase SelD [Fimbriimonadaceae bacterium]
MGPTQLAEVLRLLPKQTHPDLLVGFDTKDDAGVIRVPGSSNLALIQTMDFFTPVVDDPYSYGAIAAANALSDVYAMGGTPMTVMNIACFDPEAAPAEVWAQIFLGMAEKCAEAGATIVGGHSVEDDEPKFGLSVTGIVDVNRIFANTQAKPGERLFLSKPLGAGIATTAAKFDKCSEEEIGAAIETMSTLNRQAMEIAQEQNVRCATDITGFGLIGHLWNIARASGVKITVVAHKLPILPGIERMVNDGCITGGSLKNRSALGNDLTVHQEVPNWLREVVADPQTSGGLAVTSNNEVDQSVEIGFIESGEPEIIVLP